MKVLKKKSHWRYSKFMKLSVLFVLFYANVNAQFINESFEKTVDLPANTLIDINTRDDINYKTWDKNQLKVIVKVNITAETEEIANSFYSEIKKSINTALTDINKGKIKIFIPFKKLVAKPLSNAVKIKLQTNHRTYNLRRYYVSMTIYAPKHNNLKLKTSSASVRIEDLEANADINTHMLRKDLYIGKCKNLKLHSYFCNDIEIGNVENADITLHSSKLHKIGRINNNLTLDSKFSSFSVISAKNADVILHSSSFAIDDVQNINLEASFSKNIIINNALDIDIRRLHSSNITNEKLNNLKIQSINFSTLNLKEITSDLIVDRSHSSKFYIEKVDNIKFNFASFSHLKVEELTNSLIFEGQSGDINISEVNKGFQKIKVDGRFVNININLGSCSYKLSVDLRYPNLVVQDKRFKGFEEFVTSFVIGQEKDPKSKVSFDCNNCKIRIDDF